MTQARWCELKQSSLWNTIKMLEFTVWQSRGKGFWVLSILWQVGVYLYINELEHIWHSYIHLLVLKEKWKWRLSCCSFRDTQFILCIPIAFPILQQFYWTVHAWGIGYCISRRMKLLSFCCDTQKFCLLLVHGLERWSTPLCMILAILAHTLKKWRYWFLNPP